MEIKESNMIGKRIRFYRKLRGFSQNKVAEVLDKKSFTTIQKWERGDNKPSIYELIKLAALFDVSLNELANIEYVKEDDLNSEDKPDIYEIANKIIDRPELTSLFDKTKDAPKEVIEEILKKLEVNNVALDKVELYNSIY